MRRRVRTFSDVKPVSKCRSLSNVRTSNAAPEKSSNASEICETRTSTARSRPEPRALATDSPRSAGSGASDDARSAGSRPDASAVPIEMRNAKPRTMESGRTCASLGTWPGAIRTRAEVDAAATAYPIAPPAAASRRASARRMPTTRPSRAQGDADGNLPPPASFGPHGRREREIRAGREQHQSAPTAAVRTGGERERAGRTSPNIAPRSGTACIPTLAFVSGYSRERFGSGDRADLASAEATDSRPEAADHLQDGHAPVVPPFGSRAASRSPRRSEAP